ncbi:hypothetical protein [Providencia heimbachae]|uniref:hypothetical protein n=1 Tax=Providencia heimbachae TaxID=333962 RepID=UPI00223F88DA|nr:hypothetical protein [Providencia heimbachae]
MKPTFKERLIENGLIYIGMTLIFAALIFYGLIYLLMDMRRGMLSEEAIRTFQLVQDAGMVFIFALGAATSLAGMVYSVIKAWQRIKAPTIFPEDKESHP